LIASHTPTTDAVKIHADAALYAGLFDGAEQAQLALNPKRRAYVFLVRGVLNVNGQSLQAGDALLVADESELTLSQGQDAEVLVFDLAP
jgi:redox-sensitive bicupin YhaK (pirin superfamily)